MPLKRVEWVLAGCLWVDRLVRERESGEGFDLWRVVRERKSVWEVGLAAEQ